MSEDLIDLIVTIVSVLGGVVMIGAGVTHYYYVTKPRMIAIRATAEFKVRTAFAKISKHLFEEEVKEQQLRSKVDVWQEKHTKKIKTEFSDLLKEHKARVMALRR